MMKLITELSEKVQIVQNDSGNLFIEGVFSSAENKNNNGRIYKKDVLEREVEKLMEKVKNKCLWGELGHPPNPEINPDKISHIIESLSWVGNDLQGRAKVIDTPMGQIAKTLIKEGRMGISSRGLGTVSEADGYVNDDYFMITWDVVVDPSNQPSWVNGVYEGREFDMPGEKRTVIMPAPPMSVDNARKEYFNRIWQVLTKIERAI